MSWAASPPEIISGQIYAGAGSGPLYAAATALGALAAELDTTATGWTNEMMTLTAASGWTGTGAAAAAAAAQTYISWLTTLQAAVEQAALQATASAAAFDVVKAAVVPPAMIAANKAAQIADALSLNLPQLAADEATYAAYWAQDVAAMGVYQATSAAAGVLPPLVSVTGTINPAADAAAVTAAPAAPAASSALSASSLVTSIDGLFGTPAFFNTVNGGVNTAAWWVMNAIPTSVSLAHTFGTVAGVPMVVDSVTPLAGGMVPGTMVGSVMPTGGLAGAAASASLGEASTVGGLSVPAGWSAAAKAGTLASSTAPLEGSGWTAAAEAEPVAAMPGMPGMAAAAKGAGAYGAGPRYGFKPIVMPKQVVV